MRECQGVDNIERKIQKFLEEKLISYGWKCVISIKKTLVTGSLTVHIFHRAIAD